MKSLKRNKKGFTLIEIIVVLVIMGILIAIAVPSVLGYVNKAKEQRYLSDARAYYIGAQGIVTNKNGKDEPVGDYDLTAAKIQADAGILVSESDINVSKCTLSGTKGNVKIEKCDFAVKDITSKYISITANKQAEFVPVDDTHPMPTE